MTTREAIFAALNVTAITSLLTADAEGRCIYHVRSPDAGSYPILIYSIISDVPALTADNTEEERRVTVRIHICTRDAAYEPIFSKVNAAMLGIGAMRYSTNEIFVDGEFIMVCDYTLGQGVDSL
jgi:hypothetical protein